MSKCPKCGKKLIPVVYGMPTADTFEASERGEVRLGGCCMPNGDKERYYCKNCGISYGKGLEPLTKSDE